MPLQHSGESEVIAIPRPWSRVGSIELETLLITRSDGLKKIVISLWVVEASVSSTPVQTNETYASDHHFDSTWTNSNLRIYFLAISLWVVEASVSSTPVQTNETYASDHHFDSTWTKSNLRIYFFEISLWVVEASVSSTPVQTNETYAINHHCGHVSVTKLGWSLPPSPHSLKRVGCILANEVKGSHPSRSLHPLQLCKIPSTFIAQRSVWRWVYL